MKQLLQDLRNGQTIIEDVPTPGLGRRNVLIQTRATLISAGSERIIVEFGQASLLAKARSQPEKVRQVLDKIKTDGLLPTMEAVFSKLNEPMPLGYCNAGVVLEVGADVTEFALGDRVASNGRHADIVSVPRTLCAKIPDGVGDEQAAFTVLSSIGLQGIRLLAPTLGERFVVYGLGLIGLISAQILRANGCQVLGVDLNPHRLKLAEQFGAQVVPVGGDPVAAAGAWTNGKGIDGVLITASAEHDTIMHQSARMCRKRGRIVLVGICDLSLARSDFYEKELSFQVSCSYGPGRHDDRYEEGGQDYPYPFVRWTEQRNFQAVLDLMASGQLKVDELISHRFPLEQAGQAYETIRGGSALGVILNYPQQVQRRVSVPLRKIASGAGKAIVGVIGAGNFSKMIMLPSLAKAGAEIAYVADLNAPAAMHGAKRFGAANAVNDYNLILADPAVNAVLIAVGHNLHARLVCEALVAGKHVFVEKPLAMNVEEVRQVLTAAAACPDRHVMVGFNRRFSPHLIKMKQLLAGRSEPLAMSFTANAGAIPPEHWVHDPVRGGGRIIGEACHFIDLMAFLAGSRVRSVSAVQMGQGVAVKDDKMSITMGFEDGSVGTVNYFANGSKSYPKERMEVFSDGRVLCLDNFRRLDGYGFAGFRKLKTFRQDKGHKAEFAAFVDRVVAGGQPLIPLEQLVNATLASFAAMTAASQRRTVVLDQEYADCLQTENAP